MEWETKLKSLDPEKLNQLVNAALVEFSKGYKSASTEKIAQGAGVSKALIFHYFGNKANILQYIFNILCQSRKQLIGRLETEGWLTDSDFLSRLEKICLFQLQETKQYPYLYDFVIAIYFSEEAEYIALKTALLKRVDMNWELESSPIWKGIDYSLFRQDIDIPRAIHTARLTLSSYIEQTVKVNRSLTSYLEIYSILVEEICNYITLFRQTFYK